MAPFLDMGNPVSIVGLILCLIIPPLIDVALFYFLHRLFVRVYLIVTEVLIFFGWFFGVDPLLYFALAMFAVGLVFFLTINSAETRVLVANNMKGRSIVPFRHNVSKKQGEALFDREEVYGKVRDAVLWMSKQKIGAIITFERKDSLDEQMKSGTLIKAPVSAELLQTIFYPGTRLHDGAVVIRNDQIVAASVYYTPTTRPLTGKYGSRQRAAIGISEICDAVTVVVSEETGRISIAYQGELNPVAPDAFLDTFMDFMAMESEKTSTKLIEKR